MLSWLWFAITNNLLWLVLPEDMGMSLAAFCLTAVLVFTHILESTDSGGRAQETKASQEPLDQIIAHGFELAYDSHN